MDPLRDPDNAPDGTSDDEESLVTTHQTPGQRPGDRRGSEPRPAEFRTGDVRSGDMRSRRPDAAIPSNIYRARRPAVAILLSIPAGLAGLLMLRALAISAFGSTFLIGGVIGSCLALASLPLLVTGLYGLITGAAFGAEQWGFKVWARPPLAYLVVGIAFAIAAGLAVV